MAKPATAKRAKANLAEKLSIHNKPNDAIVEGLQKQVANAFILYLNYKHYHWQTFGPLVPRPAFAFRRICRTGLRND